MFERITIHLTGPICSCPEQNLAWGPFLDEAPHMYGLWIQCITCRVQVRIPNKRFLARFVLSRAYPGKPRAKFEPEEQRKGVVVPLHVVKGDNDDEGGTAA